MLATIIVEKNQTVEEIASHIKTELSNEQHFLFHITGPGIGDDLENFYNALSSQVGHCLDIAEGVGSEEVGGKWTHVRYDASIKNAYRSSNNPQPLHTDGSYQNESPDLTFMYCITNAAEGGETIFISAEKIVALLEKEDPTLLNQLKSTPICFAREFANGENQKVRPIIDYNDDGRIILSWNYYRISPTVTGEARVMCEQFHEFLQSHVVGTDHVSPIKLKPGEGVIWRDERLLHGRNSFVANKYAERDLAKVAIKLK